MLCYVLLCLKGRETYTRIHNSRLYRIVEGDHHNRTDMILNQNQSFSISMTHSCDSSQNKLLTVIVKCYDRRKLLAKSYHSSDHKE